MPSKEFKLKIFEDIKPIKGKSIRNGRTLGLSFIYFHEK